VSTAMRRGFYKVRFADADRGDACVHFHIEEVYVNGADREVACMRDITWGQWAIG